MLKTFLKKNHPLLHCTFSNYVKHLSPPFSGLHRSAVTGSPSTSGPWTWSKQRNSMTALKSIAPMQRNPPGFEAALYDDDFLGGNEPTIVDGRTSIQIGKPIQHIYIYIHRYNIYIFTICHSFAVGFKKWSEINPETNHETQIQIHLIWSMTTPPCQNTSGWHSLPIFKMCTYPWNIWHIIRRHIYYKQLALFNWTILLQFNTLHVDSGYSFTQTRRLICRNSHGHPQEKIWPTWSQPTPRQRETGKPGAR